MNKNIFLIGFMGTGKTTVALQLAEQLELKVLDLDQRIEEESNMSIAEIFFKYGEKEFRKRESAVIKTCSEKEGYIISCGGGAVLDKKNIEEMNKNGNIVWLKAKAETIYDRVKNNKDRPLLNENMNVSYIEEMMKKRDSFYQFAADVVIDTDLKEPKAIALEIKKLLGFDK